MNEPLSTFSQKNENSEIPIVMNELEKFLKKSYLTQHFELN